jgi:hypothetical protein
MEGGGSEIGNPLRHRGRGCLTHDRDRKTSNYISTFGLRSNIRCPKLRERFGNAPSRLDHTPISASLKEGYSFLIKYIIVDFIPLRNLPKTHSYQVKN